MQEGKGLVVDEAARWAETVANRYGDRDGLEND
jgi:hypothetical protein